MKIDLSASAFKKLFEQYEDKFNNLKIIINEYIDQIKDNISNNTSYNNINNESFSNNEDYYNNLNEVKDKKNIEVTRNSKLPVQIKKWSKLTLKTRRNNARIGSAAF